MKEARLLQGMVGVVSETYYIQLVRSHMLKHNTVTLSAISNAPKLFGPNLASVRGKAVQVKLDPVVEHYVAILQVFVLANKHLTFAADVFFIDGILRLLYLLRQFKFVTSEHCLLRTAVLPTLIKKVLRVYDRAGLPCDMPAWTWNLKQLKLIFP